MKQVLEAEERSSMGVKSAEKLTLWEKEERGAMRKNSAEMFGVWKEIVIHDWHPPTTIADPVLKQCHDED